MSVDYTPNQNNYKSLGQFRFWCQKVLPLVYDDSISYYELLGKVVNYLNETISNMELVGEDMAKVYTAFEQLQGYVNTYFDNLDVQNEIDKKLDDLASDGTLLALITPIAIQLSQPTVVSNVGEMVNIQKTYVLSSNGHIYQFRNGAWADTGLVYATDIENYMSYSALPVTDLNDLINLGVYTKGSSMGVPLNIPPTENGSAFTLVVLSNNTATYRVQMYFPTNTNRMYFRHYNVSTGWSAWDRLLVTGDLSVLTDYFTFFRTFPVTDLNELSAIGVYFNDSATVLTNTPPNVSTEGNACCVVVFSGGNNTRNYQLYFDYYNNKIYTRHSKGTVWTNWTRLLTEEDFVTAVEGKVSISKTSDTVYGINFGKYNANLVHVVNTANNIDNWNLVGVYKDGVTVVDTATDIIGPIREDEQDDFVGGLHGDELTTLLYITCDGVEWDGETTTLCNTLKISMLSEVFRQTTKEHIYNRVVNLTITSDKIVGEVCYKCVATGGSTVISAPIGGLIGCPVGIITGVSMSDYIYKGVPNERPGYNKNVVTATINWTGGSVTVNNLVGHNLDSYTGGMVIYEGKIKMYMYILNSATELANGDELFGKFEYLFA